MAHFAEINKNNKVLRVVVTDNNAPNEGHDWLVKNLGGKWIKTSYNNNIRKQFAGVGFTYDPAADVFIAPQPFPSWSLDENHDWQAPVPYPESEFTHHWDEDAQEWVMTNYSETA